MRLLDRRAWMMTAVLLGAQVAGWAMHPPEAPATPVEVAAIPLRLDAWKGADLGRFDDVAMDMLEPDAYINRRYQAAGRTSLHLAVIFGHKKGSFHSPGFCLLGGGWNIAQKSRVVFAPIGGGRVEANRFLLTRDGYRAVVLYYYLAGRATTSSWVGHQARLAALRLHRRPAEGALVRVVVPVESDPQRATAEGVAFARRMHPHLLDALDA